MLPAAFFRRLRSCTWRAMAHERESSHPLCVSSVSITRLLRQALREALLDKAQQLLNILERCGWIVVEVYQAGLVGFGGWCSLSDCATDFADCRSLVIKRAAHFNRGSPQCAIQAQSPGPCGAILCAGAVPFRRRVQDFRRVFYDFDIGLCDRCKCGPGGGQFGVCFLIPQPLLDVLFERVKNLLNIRKGRSRVVVVAHHSVLVVRPRRYCIDYKARLLHGRTAMRKVTCYLVAFSRAQ
jgi:hypothetical protein